MRFRFRLAPVQRAGIWLTILVVLLGVLSPAASQADSVQSSQDNQFGIDFVSAPLPNVLSSSQRYAEASEAGVGWNRWVIYWNNVDSGGSCDGSTMPQYNWSNVDQVVASDRANHLQIDAVLLGTPGNYATSSTTSIASTTPMNAPYGGVRRLAASAISVPCNLYQPTFADGTDTWAANKPINPANPWARFVYAVVSRYRGQIHDWEIWNEPDFSQFWGGSLPDYVRLLKVAYLAAHAADYSSTILVGGMMYWEWANQYGDQAWLKQFVSTIVSDASAPSNGYYFDVIPWHWYSRASDVYAHTISAENILAESGITGKEIWINETNAPLCGVTVNGNYVNCNDYGNPDLSQDYARGYATASEQASFIIQSVAYAFAAGADRVFQFQLQDDGNGQAFGMSGNDGTIRPEYAAYQLAVKYLTGFATVHRTTLNGADEITFGVPGPTPRRVTVLWNDTGQPVTAVVSAATASPSSVTLIQQDGSSQNLTPATQYSVSLPPATDNRNYDNPWDPNDFIIGGPTAFLVENLPSDDSPPQSAAAVSISGAAQGSWTISWSGSDPGGWGIADYTVQYRDLTIGGYWVNWLTNTTSQSASFSFLPGHTYQFRSLARSWSGLTETKCVTQADTTITASTASSQAMTNASTTLYLPWVGQAATACGGL